MRAVTRKLYQRVSNVALAFMLVLSTVTASLPFLSSSDVSAVSPGLVTITGDTAAAENAPGWLFNRDASNSTPIGFNTGSASTGSGSLYVEPLSSTVGAKKFIAENFIFTDIDEINSVSFDYKIGSGGAPTDANQFYMNVYANFGVSPATKYYDCKYDVVATLDATSAFQTLTFDPTQSYPVTRSGSAPEPSCPAVPADMGAGASVRMFALNLGDTSLTDANLDGYFDNVVLDTVSGITTYDFEPDTIDPVITLDNLIDGQHVGGSVPIVLSVSDDNLLRYAYRINDTTPAKTKVKQQVVIDATNFSSQTVYNWDTTAWPEGEYTVTYAAVDTSNNRVEYQIVVDVDNTKPLVDIDSPASNSIQPGNFSVTGTASDVSSDITSVEYSVTKRDTLGGAYVSTMATGTANGTNNFDFNVIGLTDGFYKVTVNANDAAGNVKYDNIDIEVDSTKPSIVITSPTEDSIQPGTFAVEGVASDASGIGPVEYVVTKRDTLGGTYVSTVASGQAAGTANFTINITGLTTGFYKVTVNTYDSVGNVKYDNVDIHVDTDKPVITINSPVDNLITQGAFTVDGVASDAISGIGPVQYSVTERDSLGGSYVSTVATGTATGTSAFNFEVTGLSNGFYKVTVYTYDGVGNVKYDNVDVLVDNTKPTVAIDQPLDNSVSNGNVTLSGTASDATSSIERVEYIVKTTATLGGASTGNYEKGVTTGTTNFMYDFTGLPDGFYNITARAFDAAGNAKNTSVDITVDATAPEITLNTVADYMTGVTEFSGTASDATSGLRNDEIRLSFRPIVGGVLQAPEQTYFVTVDGSGNWTVDVDTADLTEGQLYRVVARANDNLGTSYATSNTAAVTDETTVDTLAPIVTIDPLTIAGNTPTITGEVDDATAEVYLSVDGGTPFLVTNSGTTWEYTFPTALADGDYALVAFAFDEAGNLSDTATAVMTIDTTVPATEEEETITPAGAVTPTPATTPAITPFGVLGATTDDEAATSTTNDNETGVEGAATETVAATDTDASDGTVLGIAWYWWLLLIAALAAIAGWIIAAIRRRQAEQE